MLYEILGGAVIVLGLVVLVFRLEGQGRQREQNDRMKQVLDDIHTATRARDRLDHDADAAKRVRDRFTR